MQKTTIQLSIISLVLPLPALAAEATKVSPTGNVLKMVLGLVAVLAVMVLLSWVAKRLLPNHGIQNAAIKMIGGVSVGAREKVVVLEVSGRWLVVGVAQGQVSAIADLEAGSDQLDDAINVPKQTTASEIDAANINPLIKPMVKPFSTWLQKSMQNNKTK